jgi:hypothetical protein
VSFVLWVVTRAGEREREREKRQSRDTQSRHEVEKSKSDILGSSRDFYRSIGSMVIHYYSKLHRFFTENFSCILELQDGLGALVI